MLGLLAERDKERLEKSQQQQQQQQQQQLQQNNPNNVNQEEEASGETNSSWTRFPKMTTIFSRSKQNTQVESGAGQAQATTAK